MNYCGNCIEFECDDEGFGKCKWLDLPCVAGNKTCMYFEDKE